MLGRMPYCGQVLDYDGEVHDGATAYMTFVVDRVPSPDMMAGWRHVPKPHAGGPDYATIEAAADRAGWLYRQGFYAAIVVVAVTRGAHRRGGVGDGMCVASAVVVGAIVADGLPGGTAARVAEASWVDVITACQDAAGMRRVGEEVCRAG